MKREIDKILKGVETLINYGVEPNYSSCNHIAIFLSITTFDEKVIKSSFKNFKLKELLYYY